MVPVEHSSLHYFRRFPDCVTDCSVYCLFDGSCNQKQGYFPLGTTPFMWSNPPCEFPSVSSREPLENVHARRQAFGRLHASIESEIKMPERSLIFSIPNQRMDTYGQVSIRWNLAGVLEMPQFVVSSATADHLRVQWGFGERSLAMLRAAATLTPTRYDVFGFCTPDRRLVGAVEFTGERIGDIFETHMFTVANGREIMVGDELWGWCTSKVGEATIEAKCLLGVVECVPGLPVPRL